jgi:hypothetical protein
MQVLDGSEFKRDMGSFCAVVCDIHGCFLSRPPPWSFESFPVLLS